MTWIKIGIGPIIIIYNINLLIYARTKKKFIFFFKLAG